MEFVRVDYPRARRVLLDGDNQRPTNKPFRVERGTHSFSIDEPALPPEIVEFIELTTEQAPRVLSFVPASDLEMPAPVAKAKAMPMRRAASARAAVKPPRRKKRTAKRPSVAKRPKKKPTKKKRPTKRTVKRS